MSNESTNGFIDVVKKHKKTGFIVAVLCVSACSLPVLLALLGFGGLSTMGASGLLSPGLAKLSLSVGVIGLLLLSAYMAYKYKHRTKS